MLNHSIIVRGMKENNLKNIDLQLQKGRIHVFTGVSGSGKSSVVFDTIATESNRQMILNYSQYIRNHMPRYERPNVTEIKNLSPVHVIEQKPIGVNLRSTVGTYMDIHPLLRLLFSRMGHPQIKEAIDFSSQSAYGKCPTCNGYGQVVKPDKDKLIDFNKSLKDYAIRFKPLSPSGWQGRWMITGGLFNPDKKIKDYLNDELTLLIDGPPKGEKVFAPFHTKHGPQPHEWDGLLPRFERLYVNRDISKLKQVSKEDVLAMTTKTDCQRCQGSGLNPEVLKSKIHDLNINQVDQLELTELNRFLRGIDTPLSHGIMNQMLPKINQLMELGLSYMSLSRQMNTLSVGEAQRVKIARHLGSSLNNLIYIFDEPTAGLHPEEVGTLIQVMKKLKDQGNTVLVVEHEEQIIKLADEVIEMGPQAGHYGGRVVFQGRPEDLEESKGQTKVKLPVEVKEEARQSDHFFTLKNVSQHNLKNLSVKIPKNVLVSICGVSGSGKSTLLLDAFLKQYPHAIWVGQNQIGISSRSTLATYMGMMDEIRQEMAEETSQPPGLFSFNSIGACPNCSGKGVTQPDLAFADPVTMTCEACQGKRYSKEALSYTYQGLTIADVLSLTIEQLANYFKSPKITRQIARLKDVGMDYITLGQTTSTLSGGELQRLKLASHLQAQGEIYVLDEPSSGLHQTDKDKLFALLNKLVNHGNSVILIEHDLHMLAQSDWLIELGPKGGNEGGQIMFEGLPSDLLKKTTPTARALKKRI